jgi:BolA family transcriptional regulator, general stress-responsive regulator
VSEVTAQRVETRLNAALSPLSLQVIDESADHLGHAGSDGSGHGTHFRVRIGLASSHAALSRVAKHRLVYDALRQEMSDGIHALAIEFTA